MNVTLSADDDLLAKARAYAQANNTTLNQLFREYLERLTGRLDRDQVAEEFAHIARNRGGRSPEGFVFDRREAHNRGGRAGL